MLNQLRWKDDIEVDLATVGSRILLKRGSRIRINRMTSMKLSVENMTCGHCVRTITRVLQSIDPQARVEVDLAAATVTIEGRIDPAQAIAVLTAEGYPAQADDLNQPPSTSSCCGSCH
ncbi:heavy-metal-associated domain-containing protein [Arenimonas sp. MALMAid1274]|uniref:heavy-metal-associated domain-containing protein n=1 Tax=Arenimonas sp. MALMAid1274 TaxID=3411630 RepID=UPI003BA39464